MSLISGGNLRVLEKILNNAPFRQRSSESIAEHNDRRQDLSHLTTKTDIYCMIHNVNHYGLLHLKRQMHGVKEFEARLYDSNLTRNNDGSMTSDLVGELTLTNFVAAMNEQMKSEHINFSINHIEVEQNKEHFQQEDAVACGYAMLAYAVVVSRRLPMMSITHKNLCHSRERIAQLIYVRYRLRRRQKNDAQRKSEEDFRNVGKKMEKRKKRKLGSKRKHFFFQIHWKRDGK